MKRTIALLMVVGILTFSVSAYAGDHNMITKLGRGLANIGTCVVEVPKQTYLTAKNYPDPVTGTLFGFFKGLAYGTLRLGSGVADAVLSAIPPYDQPIMEPEFVFEEWE